MQMTKPAGVFLQLLSIPLILFGMTAFADGNLAAICVGLAGLLLLWIGGRPARQGR